jgi:hypothetical protein
MKSTNQASAFTGDNRSRSRQRLRTERKALDYAISKLDLSHSRRLKARDRIRSAKQPLREARRIVSEALGHATQATGRAKIDPSDVQELRVKLLRRDLILCPEQSDWLDRLERHVAAGTITWPEFDGEAEKLLLMENSLLLQHRKAENYFSHV